MISDLLEAKRFNVEGRGEGELAGDLPFCSEADFNIVRPKHIVTIDLDHKQMINRCSCS
jgi:hypothetical protein